jgi:toxin CcdB
VARFDVYANPDPSERKLVPYFLDLQNEFLEGLDTRVVVPLRATQTVKERLRNLHPELEVEGRKVVMDTPAVAAVPATELRRPIGNLQAQRLPIQDALDTLSGSY